VNGLHLLQDCGLGLVGVSSLATLMNLLFFPHSSAPLFLRKLVLGIPAQASGKNNVAVNAYGAPIRPPPVSLRHIIASSMLTK